MSKMKKQESNLEVTFLKGLGIIAVVLGHTHAPNLVPIIYYWHLPLFFFIIGLTYNPEKYEKRVSHLMASRLHSFFPMYFCYMIILGLFHNTFYAMGILPHTQILYDIQTGLNAFWNYFHLIAEPFGGPLWFMFPYFYATLIYGVLVSVGTLIQSDWKKRQPFIIVVCILCACIGFMCVEYGIVRNDFADIALVIMPIVAAGGVYRSFRKELLCFINKGGFVIGSMLILGAHFRFNAWIILDQRKYIGFIQFYLLAFSGIYCCLYLAHILEGYKEKRVCIWICKIGNYSMDIMTLHFLFFKLVDFYYSKCVVMDNNFVLSQFPHSLYSGWSVLVYTVVGICGPIFMRKTLDIFFCKMVTVHK